MSGGLQAGDDRSVLTCAGGVDIPLGAVGLPVLNVPGVLVKAWNPREGDRRGGGGSHDNGRGHTAGIAAGGEEDGVGPEIVHTGGPGRDGREGEGVGGVYVAIVGVGVDGHIVGGGACLPVDGGGIFASVVIDGKGNIARAAVYEGRIEENFVPTRLYGNRAREAAIGRRLDFYFGIGAVRAAGGGVHIHCHVAGHGGVGGVEETDAEDGIDTCHDDRVENLLRYGMAIDIDRHIIAVSDARADHIFAAGEAVGEERGIGVETGIAAIASGLDRKQVMGVLAEAGDGETTGGVGSGVVIGYFVGCVGSHYGKELGGGEVGIAPRDQRTTARNVGHLYVVGTGAGGQGFAVGGEEEAVVGGIASAEIEG